MRVDGRLYRAHRLAWLYVHGEWPKGNLDHINRDGCDNRIANLRLATYSENGRNSRLRSSNTSGFRGVYRRPNGRFTAQIWHSGACQTLGTFDTIEEAHAIRREAARELYGEFAIE
jgi:hypothetical protein